MRVVLGLLFSLCGSSAEASNLIWPDASAMEQGSGQVRVGGVVQPYVRDGQADWGAGGLVGGRYALSDQISVGGGVFGLSDIGLRGVSLRVSGQVLDREHVRASVFSGVAGGLDDGFLGQVGATVGAAVQANTDHVVFDVSVPVYGMGMSDLESPPAGTGFVMLLTSEISLAAVLGDHQIRGGALSLIPVVGYRYAPETGFTAAMDVGVTPMQTPLVHASVGCRF